ncbi:MAG: conserved membrane protein of unknown function [Promethearchaeota archaeon]|nr:MAG: conserved membrane protein of unknown function [Candidatus Lokiarchaeota archaeon]
MMLQNGIQGYEILYGILSVIFVFIAIIIGLRILTKYFELKMKELITVGLALIFLSSAWWGSAFSFLAYLLFNYEFTQIEFLFFGDAFIFIALLCWMYSFLKLAYPNWFKKVFPPYIIICGLYEVFFIYFLFSDPDQIATIGNFNSEHQWYGLSFLMFSIGTILITGILFARESMKSDIPKIQLKGKFILAGMFSLAIGGIFDAGGFTNPIILIIIRILLISSAIEYYLGFLMSDRLAKLLIGDKMMA